MTGSDDLLRRIARVGGDIDPALSERDVERLVHGARRRGRRRVAARLGWATVAVGVGVAVLVVRSGDPAGQRPAGSPQTIAKAEPAGLASGAVASAPTAAPTAPHAVPPADPPAALPEPLRLADGSVATPLDATSTLAARTVSDRRVIVELVRGRGRFDVAARPWRQFSVSAGDVTVTALGTVFTVERVADRIGVAVEHGRVVVDWGSGTARLGVDDSGWFPPLQVGARSRSASVSGGRRPARAELAVVEASPRPPAPPTVPAVASTQVAASPAPSSPPAAMPPPAARNNAPETAETLLAAADAARLAGRAQDGADLLRRVLQHHRRDPRAPLAAFTLGRVLLMELGQPRQAAVAFAEARTLAPEGPFAEDALAREVEALAKAGDTREARARSQEYQRLYPSGRRAPAVRALGGQE